MSAYATSITKANAFEQIVTDVNSIGADIIILMMSWMKKTHADDALTISGYICLRKNRVKRRSGGVAALSNETSNRRVLTSNRQSSTPRIFGVLWPTQWDLSSTSAPVIVRPGRITTRRSSLDISRTTSNLCWKLTRSLCLCSPVTSTDLTEPNYKLNNELIKSWMYQLTTITSNLTNRPDLFAVHVAQSLVKTKPTRYL